MPDPTTTLSGGRTRRPIPEAPAEPYRPRPTRPRALLLGLAIFAAFAAFGSIIWLAYLDGAPGSAMGEPPLIKADATPLKLAPDDPGGRVVADQGEVRELFSDQPSPQPEQLLPPPEEPRRPAAEQPALAEGDPAPADLPAATTPTQEDTAVASAIDRAQEALRQESAPAPAPPQPAGSAAPEPATPAQAPAPAGRAEPQTQAGAEAALDSLLAEVTGRETPAGEQPTGEGTPEARPAITAPPPPRQESAAPETSGSPAVDIATIAPGEPVETPSQPPAARPPASPEPKVTTRVERPSGTPTPPAAKEVQPASAGPSYRIQLAAVREEADARRAWDLFQFDLGDVLSGLEPIIERADTANGVFYRVQVGPFQNLVAAESLCDDLKRRNASCFVIRR